MAKPFRIALAFALAAASPAGNALETGSLDVGGLRRTYVVALPEQLKPGALVPLVILLHGAGGRGLVALQNYRWDTKAAAEGFIAVAPDAAPAFIGLAANFRTNPRYWNDGSDRGPAQHRQVDDTAFIARLIDQLVGRYPIDTQRVYATGFSSGASMVHRIGIELADRLDRACRWQGVARDRAQAYSVSALPGR